MIPKDIASALSTLNGQSRRWSAYGSRETQLNEQKSVNPGRREPNMTDVVVIKCCSKHVSEVLLVAARYRRVKIFLYSNRKVEQWSITAVRLTVYRFVIGNIWVGLSQANKSLLRSNTV